ncbi:MAG: hypothetical protein LBM94_06730 [Propionibacteriaceae bacterium]|nr:hypothetical protein [Propionibacteriaceae bacterium]
MDDLIEESLCIVSGRVVDVRYDILYDTFDYRDGETPLPPEAMTVITIEVTHVFMGATEPADKIEVYQMGGVMGQTLFSYDQMPFLADHDGEDLVLFLRTWNYSLAETTPYALADSIGGAWLDESGNLSLLWGVVYDNKEYHPVWVDPADRKVPGAPEFPTVMTVDELKQAIAEHK